MRPTESPRINSAIPNLTAYRRRIAAGTIRRAKSMDKSRVISSVHKLSGVVIGPDNGLAHRIVRRNRRDTPNLSIYRAARDKIKSFGSYERIELTVFPSDSRDWDIVLSK